MNLRTLAAVAALTLTAFAAHGQVAGLYINPIGTRASNSTADTGPYAFLGQNSTSAYLYGVNFGGYYNVYHVPPLELGLDIHEAIQHGNNASLKSFMVGLRLAGKLPSTALKPFVEPAVGAGTTKAPTAAAHVTKVQYGISVGADYPLGRHIDLRILEVGYNSLTTSSSATIGASGSVPAAGLLTFTSGLVFRIP